MIETQSRQTEAVQARFVRRGRDVIDTVLDRSVGCVDEESARETVEWMNGPSAAIEDYVWTQDAPAVSGPAGTDAARELAELNALHIEQALIQARIEAAIERLLDTDAETLRVFSLDHPRADMLPGSRVHVLYEEWKDGRLSPKYSAHLADSCPGHWCHADGKPRSFGGDPVITFAFRGEWILAGWDDDHAVLVRQ